MTTTFYGFELFNVYYMNENNENYPTHKSEINATMAFT